MPLFGPQSNTEIFFKSSQESVYAFLCDVSQEGEDEYLHEHLISAKLADRVAKDECLALLRGDKQYKDIVINSMRT